MMKKSLKFTKAQLETLYVTDKLSLTEIGNRFDCDSTNILYWLKKFKIPRRPAYLKKIDIPKEVLSDLYWNKGIKPKEIAKRFGIKNERTIRKKLEKYGIIRKTVSEALTKKFKAPFTGNLAERAYLLGLRTGDFHAKWVRKSVRIQSTTTHEALITLLQKSFAKYGETCRYLSKHESRSTEWFIYADLHPSFDFLVNKPERIPAWVINNNENFYNFLAAYCDCESNWNFAKSHKNSWRVTFRLRTGDKTVLKQIKRKLQAENLKPSLSLGIRKGFYPKLGKRFNVDIYNLVLNRKSDILQLITKMLPLSVHTEKIRKMRLILENKDAGWKEIEQGLIKIREEIKKEILRD
jgi:hypothetical protein